MKIVNTSGLPDLFYRFLTQDFYDGEAAKDTYSATTLLKPIQEVILTRRHWGEIEVDAADRIWSVFGSAVHAVLERLRGDEIKPIRRMYATILDTKISGKFDIVNGKQLADWKVTSAWTLVYRSRDEEWRDQLSIYRWLHYKETGETLEPIGLVLAILRDWDKKHLEKYKDYPKTPVAEIPIKLMSIEGTEEFITGKVSALLMSTALPDSQLPECTDEERWLSKKTGVYNKCAKYCQARAFCLQANKENQEPVRIGDVPPEPLFKD